jgi:peptide/nickel transport system substrate-binding protein
VNRNVQPADKEAVLGMLGHVMPRRAALGLLAGTVASAALIGRSAAAGGPVGSAPGAGSRFLLGAGSVDPDATFRMAGDQTMTDMDPRTATGQLGVIIKQNMFRPLVSVDSATGEVTPVFAAALPEEEDPQTFLITIVPGQKWDDGSDVTAADMKYTIDWMLDPDNGSLFGETMLDLVESVDEVDAETIRLHLNRVSGSFLDRLAVVHPVPQAIAEEVGPDQFKISPSGLGPFKFDSFVVDDSATLSRWDDYPFEPKAPVAIAKVSRILEGSGRINGLQGGQLEADIIVDPQLFPVVEGAGLVGQEWDCAGYNAIMLNAGDGPFADARVRQAMAHCINRDELVTAVWNGMAQPQVGPIPPAHFMASSPVPHEFDPERSIALLEEAGVAGLEIELMQGIYSTGLTMAAVLQAQLEVGGFKATIKTGDSGGLYNFVFDGNWQAYSMRGNTSIVGTYADIYCRWTSRDIFNNAPEEDLQPLLDALVAADLIPATEVEERKAAYAAIEQMIVDDARIIYLVNHGAMTATVPNVEGLEMGVHQAPLALTSLTVSA